MTLALMWEARAAEGRAAELLAWVRAQPLDAVPRRRETFSAPGDRVLVVTWWDADADSREAARPAEDAASADAPSTGVPSEPAAPVVAELPEPPAELLQRPVHRWHFTSLGTD
ncbi:hypothetical protein JGS22_004190 [Streptomyces sp. P38-E01]|uniref:Uncharacterized protein n=1 Tax=Streptomyces tardus TaxID=2780544 RepID=A0A949N4D9_9ACTN|nr:hypothetical protein [Streptomyces tardus]MBU7596857.1 hypothetical protein [Streptomyces tardus]